MGRKSKSAPPVEQLYATVNRMLVPEHILKDFEIMTPKRASGVG
jgi:hypothetical protein